MKVKSVYLYTDGSSLGNPGPGGYGIILEWVGMSYVKEFSAGFSRTTNNRMELLAVIKGLELLKNPEMEVVVYSRPARQPPAHYHRQLPADQPLVRRQGLLALHLQ